MEAGAARVGGEPTPAIAADARIPEASCVSDRIQGLTEET